MARRNIQRAGVVLILLGSGAIVPAIAEVGTVVFTVGEARILGQDLPIKRGDPVDVGQTVVTGASGHAHIRFVDQGFVSVRPDSELNIQDYTYDPAQPSANRVRFTLHHGSSRLITGKAGQAAKQNFRLNTPVAAIGVRGTDFLVQADAHNTRVAVQQGAVVIAPFGPGCDAQALGPCSGELARDLAGSLTGQFLEVRDAARPELVRPSQGGGHPFALPHPEEPKVGTNPEAHTAALHGGSHALAWGRWAGQATPAGYEQIGHNEAFVLFRALEPPNLPHTGTVSFRLTDAEAFGRTGRGGYEPATVSNARLAVDFERKSYATQFDWRFTSHAQTFASKGALSDNGRFVPDRAHSNVSLAGALSGAGDEASLLFSKRLPDDVNAYGVLHWQR